MTDEPDDPDEPEKPDKKKANRSRLEELLGSDSTNFLGTGLTMREFIQLHEAEKLAAAWCLQPPEEQKRRRRAVIELSIELGRIRETTNHATRLAELAVEAVIQGDWKMVQEWVDEFAFDDDPDPAVVRYHEEAGSCLNQRCDNVVRGPASTYAVFRELLRQVLRTEKGPPA